MVQDFNQATVEVKGYIERLPRSILPSNVSYTCRIFKQNSELRANGPDTEQVVLNYFKLCIQSVLFWPESCVCSLRILASEHNFISEHSLLFNQIHAINSAIALLSPAAIMLHYNQPGRNSFPQSTSFTTLPATVISLDKPPKHGN